MRSMAFQNFVAGFIIIFSLSSKCVVSKSCLFQGAVDTDNNWFGYISKIDYPENTYVEFSYNIRYDITSSRKNPISLIFYNQNNMNQTALLSCHDIVNLVDVQRQNIILSQTHYWSGCKGQGQDNHQVECSGGRSFISTVKNSSFVTGFSRCGRAGMQLEYSFSFKGNYRSCNGVEEGNSPPSPVLPTNLLVVTIYATVTSVLILSILVFCGLRKLRLNKSESA